jgi:membrane carboxypeptidase/penicillin-binding protein
MVTAYSVFANGGYKVNPSSFAKYAMRPIRSSPNQHNLKQEKRVSG